MAKVIGIGGIFFRSAEPKKLGSWYQEHLGIPTSPQGHAIFPWRQSEDPSREGMTVWTTFPKDTRYFGPSNPEFMINYIVEDLDACLTELRAAGVDVDERVESHEFGRFGWATDPEGNRIELWQPPSPAPVEPQG